jgi:tetratricopeptide (TPR) repeat protein
VPRRHLRPSGRRVRVVPRLAFLLLAGLWASSATAQPAERQLVVPFENQSRQPQYHWLSEGSAVVLTDDLVALGAPAIAREDRRRAFERLRVPAIATVSHATVIRIGELVGAGEVIIGSFDIRPSTGGTAGREDIIVRVRSIRLTTGRMGAEIVESGPLPDLFDIYARVARRLWPASGVSSEELEQVQPPISAVEQYVKGLLAQAPSARVTFLQQALRIYPALQRARIELWRVHTEEGEHAEALAAVGQVAPGHRLARQARFLSGVSLLHLGRHDQAFSTFADLHRVKPDSAIVNNLGIVQLRRGPTAPGDRAVTYLQEATRLDDTDSDLFFNLGYAFWLEKDQTNAIHWLREAVRRNPADDAAHYVLGVALQSNGATTEAAREKELARRLSSEYAEWEAKQPGVNAAPRGLERIKADVDVPASLRVETMIVAAEQRDQRDLAAFHLQAGRRAYQAERDAEAIAELRRAVYLSPYQSEAHLLLGRAYLRSGRLDEAIDALKIALWIDDTIVGHLVLVEAYIQARDLETARAELTWILKADPQNAEAKQLLQRLEK